MAVIFKKNQVAALTVWEQMRPSRRKVLKKELGRIDSQGCSSADGVNSHPRSTGLHVAQCGRYLITFACIETGVEIYGIQGVPGGSKANALLLIA